MSPLVWVPDGGRLARMLKSWAKPNVDRGDLVYIFPDENNVFVRLETPEGESSGPRWGTVGQVGIWWEWV